MPFSKKILDFYFQKTSLEVVFIDGGAVHEKKFSKFIKKRSLTPQYYGDGDSSKKVMGHKKESQNLSDLAYYLESCALKKSHNTYKDYVFLGFLGGRIDHELINIGEIFRFMNFFSTKNAPKVSMEDKIEFFTKGHIETEIHGVFSVACLNKSSFKISGKCLYKTKGAIILEGLSSRGLSNIGSGVVKIDSTTPIAVFKNS